MDIRNRSALKDSAAASLRGAGHHKSIIMLYSGISTALAVLLMVADSLLGRAVSGTGGLSNLGTRSLLQTLQTVLPYAQLLVTICLDIGYLRCMMDISRGGDPDIYRLKEGVSLFLPALRLNLILTAMYISFGFLSFYLGMQIFILTPYAQPLVEAIAATPTSILSGSAAMDDSLVALAYDVLPPLLLIWLGLFAILVIPMAYHYRMANYCLLENPRAGALAAMRKSKFMMHRNRFNLAKLDLGFWWYYILGLLAQVVCYGDSILPLLGVALPVSSTAAFYLFYGLYLVALFAINYAFRNYVEVTYIKAYEALLPPEAPSGGVVLGNIFDLYRNDKTSG